MYCFELEDEEEDEMAAAAAWMGCVDGVDSPFAWVLWEKVLLPAERCAARF